MKSPYQRLLRLAGLSAILSACGGMNGGAIQEPQKLADAAAKTPVSGASTDAAGTPDTGVQDAGKQIQPADGSSGPTDSGSLDKSQPPEKSQANDPPAGDLPLAPGSSLIPKSPFFGGGGQLFNSQAVAAHRSANGASYSFMTRRLADPSTLPARPQVSAYGGDTSLKLKATGYFHVEKQLDRWWMVDPLGYRYFDTALSGVAREIESNNQGEFEAKFGPKDASSSKLNWARWATGWMDALFFPSHVSVGDPGNVGFFRSVGKARNYTIWLNVLANFAKASGFGQTGNGHFDYKSNVMPVFQPGFLAACHARMDTVAQEFSVDIRNDPNLIGYFTDNELPWSQQKIENFKKLPANDPNRLAAEAWIAKGNKPADLWRYVADTYHSITAKCLNDMDPRHMNLGTRLLDGDSSNVELVKLQAKYVDVISANWYESFSVDPVARVTEAVDIPFIITEFYTKAVESGLSNQSGFGFTLSTHKERGAYYHTMLLSILESKTGVGAHWLSFQDNNPANTASDPSNKDSNKGMINIHFPDVAKSPYKDLTDSVAVLNAYTYSLLRYFHKQ